MSVALVHLMAIDPGDDLGWAYFYGGQLKACGLVAHWAPFDNAPRSHHDPEFFRLTRALCGPAPTRVDHLIWELPQIQVQGGGKGDPNQLVRMAARAGIWIAQNFDCPSIEMVFPIVWKGNVPKSISQTRIMGCLTHEEFQAFEQAQIPRSIVHNVKDAIGIGLYKLGRFSG
jgi:hypothetical protein